MIPDFLMGDVLIFDTETAVLGDYVCEAGFALFRKAKLVREWGMFVNPTISIDPNASEVHKIYDKDVRNAPTFEQLAWYFHNTLSAADIHVAYNYGYDRKVFEAEFARLGYTFPIRPMVDPFILFKQWNKYHKGKTLIKAAARYGVPYIGAHRAMNDSNVTGQILFKMAATKVDFPKKLDQYLKKQRQWVELQYKDLRDYFASKGKELPDQPNYAHFEMS